MEGTVNFNPHYTHICVHHGPHSTVAARRQHCLSINIWVGILGDQLQDQMSYLTDQQVSCTTAFW
jgi:hypothetical protein